MTFMHDLTNFMRLALILTSHDRLINTTYRVAKKTGTLCFVRLNLVKYLLMFKLISLSESGEHL